MAKRQELINDSKIIAQLLQNLLAIELWRGGLSYAEIRKRLGVAKGTINKMLKGVNKEVQTINTNKE